MYGDCIRVFADDPGFAAIVVPMMSAHKPATVERAQHLTELAEQLTKPICIVWTSEWLDGPGSEIYDASPRISMFRSATRCLKAIAAWLKYYRDRGDLLAEALARALRGAGDGRDIGALHRRGAGGCRAGRLPGGDQGRLGGDPPQNGGRRHPPQHR
jgi:hypothetical protein